MNNKKLLKTENQLVLDHIFILVRKGAPEANMLKELGLYYPGIINNHAGLGTAGTYFFFNNFYLELLWIEDEIAYRSTIEKLYNSNMKGSGFLPRFGIAFSNSGNELKLPFETKKLRWDWMQHGTYLTMATVENSYEPLYFIVPDYMAYRNKINSVSTKPLTKHKLGINLLTSLAVNSINTDKMNACSSFLSEKKLLRIKESNSKSIELEFDYGKKNETYDFRQSLSLTIRI